MESGEPFEPEIGFREPGKDPAGPGKAGAGETFRSDALLEELDPAEETSWARGETFRPGECS